MNKNDNEGLIQAVRTGDHRAFESLVKREVIDRLDHRNLNIEVDAFSQLNPSVENISRVIWEILQEPMATLSDGHVKLACVRVYETPKTWADYFGG